MNILQRDQEELSSSPPPGSGSHPNLLCDADGGIVAGMNAEQNFSDRQQELSAVVKMAVDIGLSICPPRQDGSKAPAGKSWKKQQAVPATLDKLRSLYENDSLTGIGLICGKVSGNVECLDFDDRDIYERFKEAAVATGLQPLLDRIEAGYKEHSPNGVHLLYRCEEISGSKKLATRPKRLEEMKNKSDKTKTLIETKGEGGYIIIAPTFGTVNQSGSYDLISGNISTVPTITPEERRDLFYLARTFHIDPVEKIANNKEYTSVESAKVGGSPGGEFDELATWSEILDRFNERVTWSEILDPHGWEEVFSRDDVSYWRRPGKTKGISATVGYKGADMFHCFTSSSSFETDHSYPKFSAYAVLNHHGWVFRRKPPPEYD